MRIYKYLNRIHQALLIPFVICSVFLAVSQVLSIISTQINNDYELLFLNFINLFENSVPYIFCCFAVFMLSRGRRGFKAFWSVLCFAVVNACVKSFSDRNAVLFIAVITAIFCSYSFEKFDFVTSLVLTASASLIFGILMGYIYEYFYNQIMFFADLVSGKGVLSSALFSVSDSIFSFFGDDVFRNLFFYKSYGGSLLFNDEIVTGIKDLFSNGYNGGLLSVYLSGHYYLLFSLAGSAAALLSELKGFQKISLAAVGICAVLSGNTSLFLLFIFLESPWLFLTTLVISALCYVSANIINLNIGYHFEGGVIEMIMYGDNWVYLLAGGVVFVAIGYFMFRYTIEKRGISDRENIYIPAKLNGFVKSLGGIHNIIRFNEAGIEVRNPKIINTIDVRCDINENIIVCDDERLNELKEYF